jgi:hypothetical protein
MLDLHLDIASLKELYPDPDARSTFLRRARRLLRIDRIALQRALTVPAYDLARELTHRLHGTAAVLGSPTHMPAAAFDSLTSALERRDLANAQESSARLLRYLTTLEAQLRWAARNASAFQNPDEPRACHVR